MPDSVTSIGNSAFEECSALNQVEFNSTITSFGEDVFKDCGKLSTAKFNEGVTKICDKMFYEKTSLTTVTLASTLTEIGEAAFAYTSITSVDMSKTSITTLGASVFAECKNLTTVTLSNKLTTIPTMAFAESGIRNLIVPDSVTNIQIFAFYNCTSLEKIKIPVKTKCEYSEMKSEDLNDDYLSNIGLGYLIGAIAGPVGAILGGLIGGLSSVYDNLLTAFIGCSKLTIYSDINEGEKWRAYKIEYNWISSYEGNGICYLDPYADYPFYPV